VATFFQRRSSGGGKFPWQPRHGMGKRRREWQAERENKKEEGGEWQAKSEREQVGTSE